MFAARFHLASIVQCKLYSVLRQSSRIQIAGRRSISIEFGDEGAFLFLRLCFDVSLYYFGVVQRNLSNLACLIPLCWVAQLNQSSRIIAITTTIHKKTLSRLTSQAMQTRRSTIPIRMFHTLTTSVVTFNFAAPSGSAWSSHADFG
jgi:hypothetical protein